MKNQNSQGTEANREGASNDGATSHKAPLRVAALIRRYPEISSDEVEEIRWFITKGPLIERGNLLGDESLSEKIARFRQDNPKLNKPSLFQNFIVISIILAIFSLIIFSLWDYGI